MEEQFRERVPILSRLNFQEAPTKQIDGQFRERVPILIQLDFQEAPGLGRIYFMNEQRQQHRSRHLIPAIVLVGQKVEHFLVEKNGYTKKMHSYTLVERNFDEWYEPPCKKTKYDLS